MRAKSKRVLSLFLILCLLITSASCRKKSKKQSAETVQEQDPYFQASVKEIRIEPKFEKKVRAFTPNKAKIVGSSVVSSYEVIYEYSDGKNILTLKKGIGQ